MSKPPGRATRSARGGASPASARFSRTYLEALRAADAAGAYRILHTALEGGMSLAALYQDVIAPAMYELGVLWEKGAITVADEHLATELTHRVLAALRPPSFVDQSFEASSTKPRAMLAAIQGEQHALGLRMVADLLEDAGYQTIYLGADVPTTALLGAIECFAPDLLALSATMRGSGAKLKDVVVGVRGEHRELTLLVGGQASRSGELKGAVRVDDLELLAERAHSP